MTIFIWDVGAVILHWNPKEFVTHYQNGKFIAHYDTLFGDHWKRFDKGEFSLEKIVDLFSEELQVAPEEMQHFIQAAYHSLKPNWPMIHLIQQLKPHGDHYCLTNGSQAYMDYVTSAKYKNTYGFSLNDLFSDDEIVLSAPLKIIKPEPAIYHYVKEKWMLSNKKIIFIDDSEENIAGAKKAHWQHPIRYLGNIDILKQQIEEIIKIDLS